jgi:hypothetical protein
MTSEDNGWLSKLPTFPVEMDDVGIVIKTGFSTRERLLARRDILEEAHIQGNIVIVGDYSIDDDLEVPVHNVLATMIENGSLSSQLDAPRLQYYSNFTAALFRNDFKLACTIGETYGWELDIMKASYIHYFL